MTKSLMLAFLLASAPAQACDVAQLLSGEIQPDIVKYPDYETAIGEATRRGIMGGGIYDSLHATFARRKGVERIVTRNPSHFAHAAPEVEILTP